MRRDAVLFEHMIKSDPKLSGQCWENSKGLNEFKAIQYFLNLFIEKKQRLIYASTFLGGLGNNVPY